MASNVPDHPAPDNPAGSYSARVRFLWARGRLDEAFKLCREWLSGHPDDPDAHLLLGWVLVATGRGAEARAPIEHLLGAYPKHPEVHFLAAKCEISCGRPKGALTHFEEAIAAEPGNDRYHAELAELLNKLGQPDEARRHALKARALAPENADHAFLLTRLRSAKRTGSLGAVETAAELKEALALDPENPYLHNALGEIYLYYLEDLPSAVRCFENALRIEPRHRWFRRNHFRAIARRDFVYRTLNLPFEGLDYFLRLVLLPFKVPRLTFAWIFAIPYIALVGAWVVPALFVLGPGALFYRWTVLGDLAVRTGLSVFQQPMLNRFCQMHSYARASVFGVAVAVQWITVSYVSEIGLLQLLLGGLAFFLLHLVGVFLAVDPDRVFRAWERRRRRRRRRRYKVRF